MWARRDAGAWSIPKGEYAEGEDPLAAALREFEEETGQRPPEARMVALGEVRQRGGKVVSAWAAPGDLDPDTVTSNTFSMEWPPRSGRRREFPEVDRAGWSTRPPPGRSCWPPRPGWSTGSWPPSATVTPGAERLSAG